MRKIKSKAHLRRLKLYPIKVKGKVYHAMGNIHVNLSPFYKDYVASLMNLSPTQEEREELLKQIIDNPHRPDYQNLVKKFVEANMGLIIDGLYHYFPSSVDDETISEAIYAFFRATLRIDRIKGYQTYCLAYIFGYVKRALDFRQTQLTPYTERRYLIKEIPISFVTALPENPIGKASQHYFKNCEVTKEDEERLRDLSALQLDQSKQNLLSYDIKNILDAFIEKCPKMKEDLDTVFEVVQAKGAGTISSGAVTKITNGQAARYARNKRRLCESFKKFMRSYPKIKDEVKLLLSIEY